MNHYYVMVLGTERDEHTKNTTQRWGVYIVSHENPDEAALDAATQYISMRTLDEYTVVTAFVRLKGSDPTSTVFTFEPKAAHDWIEDANRHEWQACS